MEYQKEQASDLAKAPRVIFIKLVKYVLFAVLLLAILIICKKFIDYDQELRDEETKILSQHKIVILNWEPNHNQCWIFDGVMAEKNFNVYWNLNDKISSSQIVINNDKSLQCLHCSSKVLNYTESKLKFSVNNEDISLNRRWTVVIIAYNDDELNAKMNGYNPQCTKVLSN